MTTPVIDFSAICNALAARFVAATIGTPTGAVAMRASYAKVPKSITAAPAHLLEVQNGSIIPNPGEWKHEIHIDGLLLLARRPADPSRVETLRQLWLPYLLHATVDQAKLGIGAQTGYTLDKALPFGWEWTEFEVAGDTYDAIRVDWALFITETVALTP